MLKAIIEIKLEETNEVIYKNSIYEGEFICWGKNKSRHDVVESYNGYCNSSMKKVKLTKSKQEDLEYWLNNLDEWFKIHPLFKKDNILPKESLTYYISKVQLIEDNKIIKEETFRYGD